MKHTMKESKAMEKMETKEMLKGAGVGKEKKWKVVATKSKTCPHCGKPM